MEQQRVTARDLLVLIAVMLAWGGAFTAGRVAVVELSPASAAALRYIVASAILVGLLVKAREGWVSRLRTLPRRAWLLLTLIAATGVVGYNVLLLAGLKYTSAINGSLLAGLAPLATASLAVVILREQLRPALLAGLVVSFAGVTVLVTRGDSSLLLSLELSRGDALILVSMVCFGLQSVCARLAMVHFTPFETVTYSCVLGTIILLPFIAGDLAAIDFATISISTYVAVLYLACIATVAAYLGWFYVLGRVGAARSAPFVNLVPLFGAGIALLWGEELLTVHAIAAILVMGGVRLASGSKRRAHAKA
jgi:drug/metabolite transporter (DMT)-like permease